MEDFEYSLEISDRDWECFFAECEGCNLLPPSLAGVDDSGMSDFDEAFLAQRARRVDPTPESPVNEHPVEGPPECGGSPPVKRHFGQHETGEFDSVLSGSEEDIHLQSVNIFFERLKGLREAEPSQERVENNKEAKQEEQQVSGRTLSKSCPKLNTVSDRVERALGKETERPVDTIWNSDTMKTVTAESNFSSEPETCSTSPLSFCRSPGTELFITEEDFTDSAVDEVAQWSRLHDSTESVVGSDTKAQPYRLEMWRSMDDIKRDDLVTSPETFCKKCSSREDQMSTPEGSQLVSMRRKRKKKRRFSLEAGDGGHLCERHSKEKQLAVKEGRRLFLSTETLDLKEQQNNLTYVLTPNPATIKFPENFSAQEIKIELSLSVSPSDNQCQRLQQRTRTDGNYLSDHTARAPLSQRDNTANDAADLQLNGEFQVAESPGSIENPCLTVSAADVETEKSESQRQELKSAVLQPCDERNVSVSDCENEQHVKRSAAEVNSISPLSSAESCAPPMDVVQNGKLSAAKSDLATEAGNCGPDKRAACQCDCERVEQLESYGPNIHQGGPAVEETHLSVDTTGGIISQPRPFQDETLDEALSANSTSEHVDKLPNKSCLSGNVSGLDTEQQTDPSEVLTSNIFSEKTKEEESSLILESTSNSQTDNEASQSENLQGSSSDVIDESTCYILDCTPESVLSLSNENHTDKSPGFCSSVIGHESVQEGKEKPDLLADKEVNHVSYGPKSQEELKFDLASEADEVIATSVETDKPEKAPNSVFAMSSFWREMEKLTINDILGLRSACESAPPGPLPAVKESEETVVDSNSFTGENEFKLEEVTEEISEVVSPSSQAVTWQSESVPTSLCPEMCPERTVLESETYSSQPVLTEKAQKYLKKISKTVSVHNLQALESESFSYTFKGDALQTLDEQETGNLTYLTGTAAAKKETNLPSSSANTYRISFADIFQYFFGEKPSVSSQSAMEDTTSINTGGNSVPETYDHFFSEFDNESFFYPLVTAAEKSKDKPVPIFSYSRSTSRNYQFPEAYEHFFASSSSDDSSAESDEEENYRPVKVVSRFSRKVSSTQVTTDVYENFFTDGDLTGSLFSLSSLSFRKISFANPAAREEGTTSLVPVRQSSRHQLQKRGFPVNALGNPDVMFPDPLLYQLEERISRQLALQPCRYEGLEVAVSNPRLDAPLLPLKQSDMCLVCIAFASWVLKTANPQVGDAWKAVLLANVSALSAIRYLRKYVKVEAPTSETKSRYPALTES
ncbi:PGC-1 and ERR-induced regulator in muscle protein 1 isoform X1 [Fundulus heteroclitus]|uniref:PGC-1 and ERR-induced regulator in muscle protein 1 isoform X1 n=1 Tax=Fundulus heteroclitus TaxID=8078 RepID=UPI00165B83FB|nr:PGC-1 and ERR-induced regulator in muscle protein 1 isoform X1 [Fundulus heteroclitus]